MKGPFVKVFVRGVLDAFVFSMLRNLFRHMGPKL
jgi:hypothetical protein